ncbi:MAG: winged helix-turn-helix transcriptional regulator [Spirochaetales bacterium]|nr:winged helix-turn-helix transcriptional regulator [Spirochaetales bacterium]
MNETQKRILELLASKPDMTAVELSKHIGIASRNIEANMKTLKQLGLLVRHGSTKAGHWEVIGEEKQS